MIGTKTGIIVRMNKHIAEDEVESAAFVEALARLAGVFPHEISNGRLRPGCTLYTAILNKAGVLRLVKNFEKLKDADVPAVEQEELQELVTRFGVESLIDDGIEYEFTVRRRPAGKRLIVLVHGWTGDESTFGKFGDYLFGRLAIPAQIFTYPSNWLTDSPSLVFIARRLDNWLRIHAAGCRIALVGHSLGGVVCRYFAVMQEALDHPVIPLQITLVASPSDGAGLASVVSKISFFRSAQVEEIRPNSPFLVDLNARWMKWRTTFVPTASHIGTIYGLNDAVVSISSAIGMDPSAVPITGAGHIDIVKPNSSNAEVVQTVERFMRESPMLKKLG